MSDLSTIKGAREWVADYKNHYAKKAARCEPGTAWPARSLARILRREATEQRANLIRAQRRNPCKEYAESVDYLEEAAAQAEFEVALLDFPRRHTYLVTLPCGNMLEVDTAIPETTAEILEAVDMRYLPREGDSAYYGGNGDYYSGTVTHVSASGHRATLTTHSGRLVTFSRRACGSYRPVGQTWARLYPGQRSEMN